MKCDQLSAQLIVISRLSLLEIFSKRKIMKGSFLANVF